MKIDPSTGGTTSSAASTSVTSTSTFDVSAYAGNWKKLEIQVYSNAVGDTTLDGCAVFYWT